MYLTTPGVNTRAKPHRRVRPGYKSPSTRQHSKARRRLFNNLETLSEFYGMDTDQTQFALQDFYNKYLEIQENGEVLWEKVCLDKKRIIWINPNNGFAIAALKDLEFEIQLPNTLPSYKENFEALWTSLDYDIQLLYENVQSHHENQEYCCLECHFPFATVCSELYTQFDPDLQDHPVE